MIPLSDENPQRRSTPIVTYLLIALNVLFFFLELSSGDEFIERWSFVPNRFTANPAADFITIFTSMFMHAGFMHLGGNMLYLWIFGMNVEDFFGKVKYIILYLLSGITATFAQYFFQPDSTLPNLGASGAIAGVLGAYIFLFPGEKIDVLMGRAIVRMSALIVIGFWFILQLFSSFGTLSSNQEEGGVAYMAHIGGFITGLIYALIFRGNSKQ